MFLSFITLVSIPFASPAFASPSSVAIYDFVANNSYRGNDGSCVQSIFHATQISDILIVSDSSTGTSLSEFIRLNAQQLAQFKKLSSRKWGQSVTVQIKFGSQTLTFKGESCGGLQCDSLEINDGTNTTLLVQPTHALDTIQCESLEIVTMGRT